MRILIAGRGYSSREKEELGIFELDQLRALRAAGHDVRYAAVDTRSVRHKRPLGFRSFDYQGILVYYESLPGVPGSLQRRVQTAASRQLWRGIRRSGWTPEVVHAHFGASVLETARKLGIPCVYTEHLSMANQKSLTPGELSWLRHTYALPDRLLCVSEALSEKIRANVGADARVVHNIVDTEVFSPPARRETEGPFHFVSAGNLIPVKGFDGLLGALGEILSRGVDARLTILGRGEQKEHLSAMAASLGLEDRVDFPGFVSRERMAEIYQTADAFVLASRAETFGVVYIEAMAAGLPVIATACGGPEDFVREDNGLLIPVDDPQALSNAMERMARTRSAYDSAAIARFARENFSPAAIARELEKIYGEIVPKT